MVSITLRHSFVQATTGILSREDGGQGPEDKVNVVFYLPALRNGEKIILQTWEGPRQVWQELMECSGKHEVVEVVEVQKERKQYGCPPVRLLPPMGSRQET